MFNLVLRETTLKVHGAYTSSSLFAVLGTPPLLGRSLLAEEDQPGGSRAVVLGYGLWQRHFGGDSNVLGQTLTVDTFGRRDYTIVGVMPPGFGLPTQNELWLPLGWMGVKLDESRGANWHNVLARLKPGEKLERAQAEMNMIQSRIAKAHPGEVTGTEVSVVPWLQQTVGRTAQRALLVLWGAVAGVLLIACGNVANLTLVRGASRQKEIAVRLALGADRWRVMRQLLIESLLLALIGGAAGTLLGYWAVKGFVAAGPLNIPRLAEVSVDKLALCFTFGTAFLTSIVFGLAPAWQSSRLDLNEALKEGSRGASGGVSAGRTRNSLVIVEVALAAVLLVGAGLMLQSLLKLLATDRGFRAEHVITADLDFSVSLGFTAWMRATDTRPQVRVKELLDRIREQPGVQAAGVAYRFLRRDNHPPVTWPLTIFGRPSVPERQRPNADPNAISPGFFRALGIPLLRGRDFTETDALNAPAVAIVNESFVRRFFPNEEPLGQHVTLVANPGPLQDGSWYEIIGVVGDVKSLSAQPEPAPEIFRPYWQWPMYNAKIFVRTTGDAAALTSVIRRETKSLIPGLPEPEIRLLTDYVGESVAQPRFQAELLSIFGALAMLLAACGIYGVLAYAVTQRQREIGVRIALGAQAGDVLRLVLGQGMRLVLAGIVIGVLVSLALTRVLMSLLYEVRPTDPLTFVAVCLLLAAIALLACWLPAHRATRIHPMEALRCE
jgi:putative ABC transport system permease protein